MESIWEQQMGNMQDMHGKESATANMEWIICSDVCSSSSFYEEEDAPLRLGFRKLGPGQEEEAVGKGEVQQTH